MEDKDYSVIDLDYIKILWKRKWIILLGAFLCALTAGIVSLFLPKTYEATASLDIGKVWGDYVESPYIVSGMIDSEPFLSRVVDDLKLDITSQKMTKNVKTKTVESVANTPVLITLTVDGRNPKEAVDILKSISTIIIDRHKKRFEDTMQQHYQYEMDLTSKIKEIESDISEMKKQQTAILKTNRGISAPQILLLQAGLEQKQERLLKFMQELRDVKINNHSSIKSRNTSLLDPPVLPKKPVKPKIGLNIIIAGVGGFILAIIVILFMESLSRGAKDL